MNFSPNYSSLWVSFTLYTLDVGTLIYMYLRRRLTQAAAFGAGIGAADPITVMKVVTTAEFAVINAKKAKTVLFLTLSG